MSAPVLLNLFVFFMLFYMADIFVRFFKLVVHNRWSGLLLTMIGLVLLYLMTNVALRVLEHLVQ